MIILILILKVFLRIVLFTALFMASYFLVVIILSFIPVNRKKAQPSEGEYVYLTSDGIHIDIHVPIVTKHYDWTCLFPPSTFKSGQQAYSYITFGWGDWGFYLDTPTWAELKTKTLLKAAFLKTPTVMHVIYSMHPPTDTKKKTKRLVLDDNQMQQLNQHILESIKLDQNGVPILIPDRGYEENDNFYFAEGSYHLFRTCNSWVNEAMKKIGVPTSIWSTASLGVFRHL